MTTPQFSRPASSEGFSPSRHPEWMGKLFLIRPNFTESVIFDPADGPKEMVNSFVVILDLQGPPDGRPVVIDGAQIGGAGLAPQIKHKIGQLVLGRLEQGAPQGAKSGTFKLNPNFTPQDEAAASAWLAGPYGPLPPVPNPPPAAPAPQQQWGAQPPVAEPPAYDVWQNTPTAQPAAAQPAQAPSAWQQPAAAQAPPQQWQGQAPAPQPPAQQWAQPAAPAPQQWQQPAPAAAQPVQAPSAWQQPPAAQPVPAPHQDPALVAKVQAHGIAVTAEMSMEQLQMIVNSFPQ